MEDLSGVPTPSSSSSLHARQQRNIGDGIWSCFIVLLTFWFFASTILVLCVYGPVDLILSPNCSRLLQANSFFVQDIKLSRAGETEHELVTLYGFRKPPPLDVRTTWSETYSISTPSNLYKPSRAGKTQNGLVTLYGFRKMPPMDLRTMWLETYSVSTPSNFYKEWIYYLNGQSQINISYAVKSNGSHPLILVIAQGIESLNQWIENPSHPNITLSWNLITGSGIIQQNILKPSAYYVAVGNLNQQQMEVQLEFGFQTVLYNTAGAYYKCSLGHSSCALKLSLLRENVAILTTSGPQQEAKNSYVKLSYGPRWIVYFVGSGALSVVILLAFNARTKLFLYCGNGLGQHNADFTTQTNPLLPSKDGDDLSLGSSYDSVSRDDDGDVEGWFDSLSLCSICCDARRDCFFLPCGHCATCFACGKRIAAETGICPICRRRMKKVRKIFTV